MPGQRAGRFIRRAMVVSVAALVTAATGAGAAQARSQGDHEPLPVSPEHRNMRLIGHNDLGGRGNVGEGFGEVKTPSGGRILYIAHEDGPTCLSVVDVTRPRHPKLLRQIDVPDANTRCNSLDVSGNLLVVANEVTQAGLPNAGLRIYDISDPVTPHEIGFFDASGPYSRGAHYVWMDDGRYAYLSTGMPDFQPKRLGVGAPVPGLSVDDQIPVIVDLADPRNPKEVGRWWYPGTRVGDPEPLTPPNPILDVGCRAHNVDVFASRPDRAYIGYIDCGLVVLDISDKAHPRLLATYDDSPPSTGMSHTLMPILGGRYLLQVHEALLDACADAPKEMDIWKNRPESELQKVSTVPLPGNASELCARGGRFGAHNVYEFEADEPSFRTRNVVFGSFFSGGVRAYDVSNPYKPREVGYYVPPAPEGSSAGTIQINDVYVDDRGVIFAGDRFTGGLYVFRSKLTRTRSGGR
jgi:hypothetical protein